MSLIRTPALIAIAALLSACAAPPANHAAEPSNSRQGIIDFASCGKPVWPAAALKEQRVGTVTLGFLVDTDGTVVDSKVMKSSGSDDLDQAARNGIKLCKFMPAIKDGKHAKDWVPMQYVWTLK